MSPPPTGTRPRGNELSSSTAGPYGSLVPLTLLASNSGPGGVPRPPAPAQWMLERYPSALSARHVSAADGSAPMSSVADYNESFLGTMRGIPSSPPPLSPSHSASALDMGAGSPPFLNMLSRRLHGMQPRTLTFMDETQHLIQQFSPNAETDYMMDSDEMLFDELLGTRSAGNQRGVDAGALDVVLSPPPMLSRARLRLMGAVQGGEGARGVRRPVARAGVAPIETSPMRSSSHRMPPSMRSPWRANAPTSAASISRPKTVYEIFCSCCQTCVSVRGMRAILLADTKVDLFSSDGVLSPRVRLLDEDYMTRSCSCKLRDVLCSHCGSVLGYHVSQPCLKCLSSSNNGHFWMFLSRYVTSAVRLDGNRAAMTWQQLLELGIPDYDPADTSLPYELFCR